MISNADRPLNTREAFRALGRAWPSMVNYELLMSLVSTVVLGPILLTVAYGLIGLLDHGADQSGVWTNDALFWRLLSPIGFFTLLVLGSVGFGLLLLEYAGLILLAGAALRGATIRPSALVGTMVRVTPRLFTLAAIQVGFLIVAAIPFACVGAGVYWFLLSDADINYFLAARPPRFWVAAILGALLAAGFLGVACACFARWAFSVPALVLDGETGRETRRLCGWAPSGCRGRLVLMILAWEGLKYVAIAVLLLVLDRFHHALFDRTGGSLTLLVCVTLALLLVDAVLIQLLAAFFAIGLAGWIALEHERNRKINPTDRVPSTRDDVAANTPRSSAGAARAAVISLAVLGPIASIAYALWLERHWVDHRSAMVTAHRGGPKQAPENSLAALRLALAADADFVEIDVQPTADGQVVLMHDRDLRRMTSDPRDVTDVTLADLAALQIQLNGAPTAEHVPTLAEFIAACDDKIRLNIEIKDFGSSPLLAQQVLEILRKEEFTGRAIVSCFQLAPLATLRHEQPDLSVGVILSATKGDVTQLPVNFLSVNHRIVRADLVRRAHANGMQVHVWTVNDRELALRLLDLGCDNLITSDPELMRAVVDEHARLDDFSRMALRLRRWLRE